MTRTRVLLGLAAVAVGAALAAGGVDALRRGGEALVSAMPYLLIGAGAIILLRTLLPRGQAMAGPALLIAVGATWLVVSRDWFASEAARPFASAVLVAGGVALAMSRRSRDFDIDTGVWRCTTVLVPRKSLFDRAPRKLVVRALAGDVAVDLTGARLPLEKEVDIDLFLLFGHVRLAIPREWVVVHGRLETARGIRLDGDLDPPYTHSDEGPVWHGGRGGVVLNVSGVGGTIVLERTG
ncbi:LiaF transmembrane domain-containing protein [Spirillospora sp. CA-294931]|uniref:LiaF transmembrane domain-containing protein n=1 Tax=Spirillospora sp. CA-294931 TaxID=3240042 RepID=UPI003D8EB88D